MESGFRDTAYRQPGRLFQMLIEKVSSYLCSLQGVSMSTKQDRLQPVMGAYLQSVLIPARQGQCTLRNLQELKTKGSLQWRQQTRTATGLWLATTS